MKSTMPYSMAHDTENNRFILPLDDSHIANITYSKPSDGVYLLEHTVVPEKYHGKGIAKILALQTLAYIADENKKIVPSCDYLKGFITKHPEWNFLLK